ncbi:hypothetical protein K9O30_04860 [Clostridium bowmanii]|uniref:hypothetical protein n=1 Tax=Clostridium bowmanii TaxID=132925 RepID=UPI001C0D0E03|nr:hypothetical protein [Clostridium bowmanii]MBU3189189.1 hypothetical protein [Clostridium bowmanii]MCA1073075.1 hypothetical protein [Clostridium bowmanii]
MVNQTVEFINKGFKIMKFERALDLVNGQEIGKIELKALDGHREYITLDDNGADEIERNLFEYLINK